MSKMSKKEKDWTLVNKDGSLELDSGSNSSTKSKGAMDSDSDQDFEILAKPVDKNMTSQSLAKFKGIYIKEDHFAEGTDDGSDIEVIKMTDSGKTADKMHSCSSTDSEDSIEAVDNNTLLDIQLINIDSKIDEVKPVGKVLSEETLHEILDNKDIDIKQNCKTDCTNVDGLEDDNKYEGLIELFGQENKEEQRDDEVDEDDALHAISYLFDGHYDNHSHITDEPYSDDTSKFISDRVIISSSMFIILLCLSVVVGIFIGKGLSCLSQPYQADQPQSESSFMKMEEPKVPKSLEGNKRNEKFDFVNHTSLQNLPEEAVKLKNESHDAMKMRMAYEEIQLKYLRLEKKYRDLGLQYRAQKQVMFFSRKMRIINIQKQSEERNYSTTSNQSGASQSATNQSTASQLGANQSTSDKELIWWKMRTAVWRRKYLDIKVKYIQAEKEFTRRRNANITFKACTGLLTRYIPDLNVTALLATNRIATGAKICWTKVVNPVKVVGQKVGSGFYGLSRKVDGFWTVIKSKWKKAGNDQDRPIKLTSKWRNFRRMFRMSNIIGSFGSRESEDKHRRQSEKPYCEKNPVNYPIEFPGISNEGETQEHKVSYPAPKSGKPKVEKTSENLDDVEVTDEVEATVNKLKESVEHTDKVIRLRPCPRRAYSERYDSKEVLSGGTRDLKRRDRPGNTKIESEPLWKKVDDSVKPRDRGQDDLLKKREILEKKMRYHSNKSRQQRRMLKIQERKLKKKMERLRKDFEKVFERKVNELKEKKKKMRKELKNSIEKSKKEKESLDKEKKEFREKMQKIQRKMKHAEEKLQKRRANFDKWSEEMRKKIVRENAHGINKRYNEEQKLKIKHRKLVKKMKEKIQRKKAKLEAKELALNMKVEKLRSALRRLLQEETQKSEEVKKKDKELQIKEKQLSMVKLFYVENLKREKQKHAVAKEMLRNMKQTVITLKEMHDDILKKYKEVQKKLPNEGEKLEFEQRKNEVYYPTVYCSDQKSCMGKTKAKMYIHSEMTEGVAPSVFCPRKDSCRGKEDVFQAFDGFQTFLKRKQWTDGGTKPKVIRRSTALYPVPPNSNMVQKIHPFFSNIEMRDNGTSNKEESKPNVMTSNVEKPNKSKQESSWYFSLMQGRAEQRATPLSWYLYLNQGRSKWRNAPGKDSNDNWFLRFMQERERQRNLPVDWYFKRGKGREEGQFNHKTSWFLNRGKARDEARKKEGFYYCW